MTRQYPAFPRQSVDALGIKTSFVTAGDRRSQPLLLLHGMTSSGDWYRELMAGLADEFWLIAPDLPGFGYSDNTMPYTFPHLIEWLAAFSDVLDLPPLMVAGHSFGGSLATSYTLTYPEDVTRLLLIAPAVLASKLFPHYLTRAGINLGLVDLGTVVSQSRAVVGQQVSVKGARTVLGRIAARTGPRFESANHPTLTHFFPTAHELNASDLTGIGMPEMRVRTVKALAEKVDRERFSFMVKGSLSNFIEQLTRIPGIGDWTAQYIAMRAMGEPDAFPASDLGIMKALRRDDKRLTLKQIRQRAERAG